MGDFKKLVAWHRAIDLAQDIYLLTHRFPRHEQFGLTQQIRRAATSVSSNIAEGAGRGSERAFHGFIRIARGSLHEVRSQIYLSIALGYLQRSDAETMLARADELGRILSGMLRPTRP